MPGALTELLGKYECNLLNRPQNLPVLKIDGFPLGWTRVGLLGVTLHSFSGKVKLTWPAT